MTNAALESPTPPRSGRNTLWYAIYGALFGLAFPVIASIVGLATAGLRLSGENLASLHTQALMLMIDTAPFFLGAVAALAGRRQDALESALDRVQKRTRELQDREMVLQERVTLASQQLEQRDRRLRAAVDATRRLAQVREEAALYDAAVQLIGRIMGDGVVDLYLIDDRRMAAILTASSEGETAAVAVPIGDPGLIGQVAATGQQSTTGNPSSLEEFAFPLHGRGKLVGVLHLRPAEIGTDLALETGLFQLLADQLASALEMARLYSESRDAVRQLQVLSARATASAWEQDPSAPVLAFEFTPAGIRPANPGETSDDPEGLEIPLVLRGQRIGRLRVKPQRGEGWSEADRDLAQKTADQVALALENLRLLEETRERAAQEQKLSAFSARLSQSTDIEGLLQAAVRELATLPDVSDAAIYVNPSPSGPAAE